MSERKREKFIILFLSICFALFCFQKIGCLDVFWILNNAKWSIKLHHIITQDIFTYTYQGMPYYNQNWLFGFIIYFFYLCFGFSGLTFFKMVIAALVCNVLYLSSGILENGRKNPLILVLVFLGSAVYVTNSFWERPQILSILMIAIYIYCIYLAKNKGEFRPLYLLPFLQIIWINSHLMAYWGVLLLSVAVFDSIIEKIEITGINVQGTEFIRLLVKDRCFSTLFTVLLCVIAANLLNPLGSGIYFEFFKFYQSKDALVNVVEWQKPFVSNLSIWDYHLQINIYIMFLFVLMCSFYKRVSFFNWVLFFLGIWHYFNAIRFINLLFVLTVPIFYSLCLELYNFLIEIDEINRILIKKKVGIILIIIFFLFMSYNVYLFEKENPGFGVSLSGKDNPSACIKYLQTNNIKGKVLNSFAWGGLISFNLYPDILIFMDGRQIILYDNEFTWLDDNYTKGFVSFLKVREKYPFDMVLLKKEILNVDPGFYDDWAVVMVEEDAVLFLDRKKYPDIISKYDLTGIDIKNAGITGGISESKVQEIKKRLEYLTGITPENSFIYACLSNIYLNEKDYPKALQYILIAEELQREKGIINRAIVTKAHILEKMGNYTEAINCYKNLIKRFPNEISFKESLAKMYEMAGFYENAFDFTLKYVDKFSPNARVEGYDRLGRIYYLYKNDPEMAIEMYNRAQMLTDIEGLLKIIYYNRGNIYYDQFEYENALKDFERYLVLEGINNDGEIVYKTGCLYVKTGKPDIARKLYLKYLNNNNVQKDKWYLLIKKKADEF